MHVLEAPARRGAAVALAIACAAVLPFAGTLGHGFAFDDGSEIVRNEDVRSIRAIPRMFTRGAWEGAGDVNPIYRPLTSVTYALNHAAGGLSPVGYHLVNVLLHALVSVLVLALGLEAGLPLAAAGGAALLFAVHPIHVEVVANVAGRKDALATLFVLCALLAHARALRQDRKGWLLAAPLALAGALFSKESGAAAIPIIAAWDLLLGRQGWARRRSRAIALYAVYAAELAIYLAARRAAVGSLGVPIERIAFVENPLAHVGVIPRLMTAVAVVGKGLWLLAVPTSLSPDYSWNAIPVVTSPRAPAFLAAAAILAAIAWGAWRLRGTRPVLSFCAAWYAAALLPASNLLVPVGTTFGERLLYMPSVAFCVALAAAAHDGLVRAARPARRIAAAAGLVALCTLALASWKYAATWRDEVSLFAQAVRSQPASARAHELLGAALAEEGRVDEGARELERAVEALSALERPPARARIELGVAYERLGRPGDAGTVYADVLRQLPEEPDALWRLGVVRWSQGGRDEAERLWQAAIAVAPEHARAMNDLGIALYRRGDVAAAEAMWVRATRADPLAAGPWLSLGRLYDQNGDPRRARDAFERFLDRAHYGVYPGERRAVEERLRALDAAAQPGATGAPPAP
jgi:tetratricopeptide (TPR) repeat protein